MLTPTTVSLWIEQQAIPLAFLLLVLGAGAGLLYLSASSRRRRLLRERAGLNEDTFVGHLATYDFDPQIARAAYRRLRQDHRIDFPILPSDALDEDLGLDDRDIHATVRAVLEETNRRRGVLHGPVITVEDLIRYLQSSPRNVLVAA